MSAFSDGLPVPLGGLPPMEPRPQSTPPALCRSNSPKGKAGNGQTGQRFRVLNDFVDFTLAELNRAEIAVWLILYRGLLKVIYRGGFHKGSSRYCVRPLSKIA
jgi:hypothetical protein